MNVRKRSKDSARSGLTGNRLFGALGHIHNPFSIDSDKSHGFDTYQCDENIRKSEAKDIEVELAKAKVSIMTQNLIARFQKS